MFEPNIKTQNTENTTLNNNINTENKGKTIDTVEKPKIQSNNQKNKSPLPKWPTNKKPPLPKK